MAFVDSILVLLRRLVKKEFVKPSTLASTKAYHVPFWTGAHRVCFADIPSTCNLKGSLYKLTRLGVLAEIKFPDGHDASLAVVLVRYSDVGIVVDNEKLARIRDVAAIECNVLGPLLVVATAVVGLFASAVVRLLRYCLASCGNVSSTIKLFVLPSSSTTCTYLLSGTACSSSRWTASMEITDDWAGFVGDASTMAGCAYALPAFFGMRNGAVGVVGGGVGGASFSALVRDCC